MNFKNKRQIFLDIETTGMNKSGSPFKGHRIIEIGAVETINRQLTGKYFHVYLKPNRLIDINSFNIHGISDEFLIDKPTFNNIYNELIEFINGSELIIHNASFDVGFINHELSIMDNSVTKIHNFCNIIDSLEIAKKIFPNKRNNLDALCDRFFIDRSKRTFHGALLDAKILSEIFLLMTSDQNKLNFLEKKQKTKKDLYKLKKIKNNKYKYQNSLKIIFANKIEILAHEKKLNFIQKEHGNCLWKNL